ncbi:MAG: ABC transporter substrate-binding protein [Alphaproteobacteria bacterium]|nr:ABC transporter substrate-binding protein [Magnetovibrio sp.]HBC06589.1 ABC transporter substrate-binding protein [Rhodospirillaceae bacterium]HBT43404.1 ABC transporter substrate-binding protein [Rhodospirillaceae bacterium]HCS68861.1 ABC transporter substrate-binding protein [Rhodospirillaceae bacterium]|tara:strand:- start:12446 stop:13759 length:1314 start_codon:yes stop_codon:yes gene_type:complete
MTKDVKSKPAKAPRSGQTRRSFLQTALAGGAAATTAYFGITHNAFAKASGPIVIGHQCELTGGFSSWGYWHDKCAQAAVKVINEGGGIAGRKVELAVADTESNPAAGARKLRSLIQRQKASFVVGSVHSGIMLASIPIATELKTPYFSAGEATEATGSKGSRYSFRTGTDTYALAAAGVPWAMENLGKNWTMIFPDYAWGHSHHQEHRKLIEAAGGKVNDPIAVPLGTKDLVPYLARIPEETEVLFSVFFGALSVAFYTQSKSMRLDEKMKMYSVSGTIEAIDPRDINGATEGVYFLENFPRPLEFKNDEYHAKFIEMMGVDPVYAKDDKSGKVMAKSHAWQSYENFFALKAAIEASGWQSDKDTPGVIEALEGLKMENSLAHPQGTKILRAEDHSGMIDCYMSRVEDSKFVLKKHIPREDLMAKLPPRYDFRTHKL